MTTGSQLLGASLWPINSFPANRNSSLKATLKLISSKRTEVFNTLADIHTATETNYQSPFRQFIAQIISSWQNISKSLMTVSVEQHILLIILQTCLGGWVTISLASSLTCWVAVMTSSADSTARESVLTTSETDMAGSLMQKTMVGWVKHHSKINGQPVNSRRPDHGHWNVSWSSPQSTAIRNKN